MIQLIFVAPLVGAWIEIDTDSVKGLEWDMESLLSWERGLKSHFSRREAEEALVAPLVGAWIEIPKMKS